MGFYGTLKMIFYKVSKRFGCIAALYRYALIRLLPGDLEVSFDRRDKRSDDKSKMLPGSAVRTIQTRYARV